MVLREAARGTLRSRSGRRSTPAGRPRLGLLLGILGVGEDFLDGEVEGFGQAQCDPDRGRGMQTFTVEAAGPRLTTETTPVDAATTGDETFAALTQQSLATGETQTVLTVTGIKATWLPPL
jgi:hypothetical protein